MIRPDRSVMQTPLPVDEPSGDEELYGLPADPDSDPPGGAEAWLAGPPTPSSRTSSQDGRSSLARLRVMAVGFLPRSVPAARRRWRRFRSR